MNTQQLRTILNILESAWKIMNIPEYVWVLLNKQASKYNITSSIYYFIALPTNRKTFCSLTVEHKPNVQDSTSRNKAP